MIWNDYPVKDASCHKNLSGVLRQILSLPQVKLTRPPEMVLYGCHGIAAGFVEYTFTYHRMFSNPRGLRYFYKA